MEWNAKWDWENLDIFSSKAIASPKKLEAADWGIVEGEEDIDAGGSFNLSGGFGGTSRSASDIGNNSSAKSSLSASTESSFKECLKTSNFTFDGFGGFPGDFSSKKDLGRGEINGDSPPLEASVGSGEPFIGLKLGKRTYFENGCAKSSSKASSFSDVPVSSMATAKKVKSSCQMGPTPRCQVEGCNLDLSSAKDYHRKHRVCGNHSRCPLVVIGGLERRFCQQCSRFHSLSEFDEQKRSCRRRLSDHNARRRKPQQETIQFNSSSLSSSFYDGQHQLSFVLNNVPAIQTRPAANSTWDGTFSSKYLPAKPKAEKEGESIDGQPHFLGTQLPHSASMPSHAFSRLLPSKGSRLEVLNQGLKESMASSDVEAALDYRRALSLLSNNSWASCESDLNPINHTMNGNQTISIPQSGIQTFPPQGLPLSSSHYWQVDQQSNDPHMVTVAAKTSTANTHHQGPYETRFYSHHSMN